MNKLTKSDEQRCRIVLAELDMILAYLKVAWEAVEKGDIEAAYFQLCNATGHLNKAREVTFKK